MSAGKLTAAQAKERAVLDVLNAYPDHALYFRGIVDNLEEIKIDERGVRRIVRRLARKGYAELVRGLFDDDGRTAGSGYAFTDAGAAALASHKSEG